MKVAVEEGQTVAAGRPRRRAGGHEDGAAADRAQGRHGHRPERRGGRDGAQRHRALRDPALSGRGPGQGRMVGMTRLRATLAGSALLVLGSLGLLLAPAAHATGIDEIGAALRGGDIVYVEPGAEGTLSAQEAQDLREQVTATGVPMFIAVLTPESAKAIGDGSPDGALTAVHDAVGLDGVYGMYAGNAFRAGSTSGRSVTATASAAKQRYGADGPAAVLGAFVGQVGEASTGRTGEPSNPAAALVPAGHRGRSPRRRWLLAVPAGPAAPTPRGQRRCDGRSTRT